MTKLIISFRDFANAPKNAKYDEMIATLHNLIFNVFLFVSATKYKVVQI